MTQLAVMTVEQLNEFAENVAAKVRGGYEQHDAPEIKRHYVYGLRGIAEMFNVSLVTAQKYKNTFLAPAVMQRGRKLVIDADKAIELFNAR